MYMYVDGRLFGAFPKHHPGALLKHYVGVLSKHPVLCLLAMADYQVISLGTILGASPKHHFGFRCFVEIVYRYLYIVLYLLVLP